MSKETFWIKIYLSNNISFNSFSEVEQKLFGFLAKCFWARFSKLQFYVLSNVFMNNVFFEKRFSFSIPSSVFKQNFFKFLSKFLTQSWQKRILYVQMDNSYRIIFLKKLIIVNVYDFWAITSWHFPRNSNRVAKTVHCMLGESFAEKQLFKKTFRTFFGLPTKRFRLDFWKNFRRF